MATCAPSYAFINGELSGVGCSAYSHIKQAGGEMPSLLPFDINQLKASLRLLLHLFSSSCEDGIRCRSLFHLSASGPLCFNLQYSKCSVCFSLGSIKTTIFVIHVQVSDFFSN